MVTTAEMKEIVDRCWSLTERDDGRPIDNMPYGFESDVFILQDLRITRTEDVYTHVLTLNLRVEGCGPVFLDRRDRRKSYIEWGDLSQGAYILSVLRKDAVLDDLAGV